MPLYVDIHRLEGLTLDMVAEAHRKDLEVQAAYGVNYLKYWCNEPKGRVFCMCTAPSAEAAERVHMEATRMRAERVIEVDEDLAETLMGSNHVIAPTGAVWQGDRPDPGSRTIMFTDIVGSTALTQQLGDHGAMAVIEAHDRVVRAALRGHGGREVKHLGDGIMAVFHTPQQACACASEIQRRLRELDGKTPLPIWLKIGAASGDPVEREGDFFGSTVQLASRLCAHAGAGQTLVSEAIAELNRHAEFEDLGEVQLKGFTAPVRARVLKTA